MAGFTSACLAGWAFCLGLNAQEPSALDRPAVQGDSFQPAELARESARRVFFELRLAEIEPVRGLTFEATVKASGRKIHLHYTTVVTNGDISRARVLETGGRYEVAIRLTDEGAAKMASATARHVGRPVVVILDGGVIADLTVRAALGAEVVFSADFTRAEAMRIVDGLNRW
jgi:preprotein translocase subunit SecD